MLINLSYIFCKYYCLYYYYVYKGLLALNLLKSKTNFIRSRSNLPFTLLFLFLSPSVFFILLLPIFILLFLVFPVLFLGPSFLFLQYLTILSEPIFTQATWINSLVPWIGIKLLLNIRPSGMPINVWMFSQQRMEVFLCL